MTDMETARAAAQRLMADREARAPHRTLTDLLPAGDLEAAYATQETLHGLMAAAGAGEIAGYKIALTTAAMREMLGVDQPLAGAIFSTVVHTSPATLAAADFQHLGIECEVAVRLGEDLPAAQAPFSRERIADSIGACMPAFELIEDRGADYKQIDAVSLTADNVWNGGVVLGPAVTRTATEWLSPEFTDARTQLAINGTVVGEGRVGDAMGHPFEAVAWIANLLAGRGKELRRDMIVITGSSVTTRFPVPGDTAHFTIDGMGAVDLTLAG